MLAVRRGSGRSPRLPELRLNCRLPDGRYCAKCCYNTEMPLTREDIERIEMLGYPRSYFVVLGPDSVPRLRNINGHCVFLDPETGKCRIYEYRPLGCRLYPLVYVPGEGVTVDLECPLAHTVPKRAVKKLEKYVVRLVREIYGELED